MIIQQYKHIIMHYRYVHNALLKHASSNVLFYYIKLIGLLILHPKKKQRKKEVKIHV